MQDLDDPLRELVDFFQQISKETDKDYTARLSKLQRLMHNGQEALITLNKDEVDWAGKIAWRNSEKCIGRLPWKSLKCFDAQSTLSSRELFQKCLEHIDYSTNKGRIIPTMTFFAHHKSSQGFQILNEQLVRYAGYKTGKKAFIGDPAQVQFTELAVSLGWKPPRHLTSFDLLPIIIRNPDYSLQWFEIPKDLVLEVQICHPDYQSLEQLGLKWHALPAISNKYCDAAGLKFPCVFSGYYMVTEIASRNFLDVSRYNLLIPVANALSISIQDPFWKDQVMIEMNRAVFHSFREAGVTIVDHHTASAQFMKHLEKEECKFRKVVGDWSWLVPPTSGSLCPVFHRYYSTEQRKPRFSNLKL